MTKIYASLTVLALLCIMLRFWHVVGGELTPSCAASVRMYYDFVPHPGWRFIVLDTYDVCAIGDQKLKSVNYAFDILSGMRA